MCLFGLGCSVGVGLGGRLVGCCGLGGGVVWFVVWWVVWLGRC